MHLYLLEFSPLFLFKKELHHGEGEPWAGEALSSPLWINTLYLAPPLPALSPPPRQVRPAVTSSHTHTGSAEAGSTLQKADLL